MNDNPCGTRKHWLASQTIRVPVDDLFVNEPAQENPEQRKFNVWFKDENGKSYIKTVDVSGFFQELKKQ